MRSEKVLGLRFLSGDAGAAVSESLTGGLVVVPSAPVLVGMAESQALRDALLGADWVMPDSGLMVLLWRLITGRKIERVSGLEYLKVLLSRLKASDGSGRSSSVFWVMPTRAARDRNLAWLRAEGFPVGEADCYLAPQYPAEGALVDEALASVLKERRPDHVILAIGGGVQERLGWFLRQRLAEREEAGLGGPAYRPGIHCIGAAIGFLTGDQVRIPMWVDYLYLGWLWRCVSAPRRFVPRYWKALKLVALMVRYRAEAPPAPGP